MSSDPLWDLFDGEPFEKMGRYVPDSFGNPIVLRLERVTWAYIDWYMETYGIDQDRYFQKMHMILPHDQDFDDQIEDSVRQTYLREEKAGRPRPDWCDPAKPEDFIDFESMLDN